MNSFRSKKHLLSIIFFNNRLNDYEEIIKSAVSNGYLVCCVSEFYNRFVVGKENLQDKVLILRHDIDYINPGTKRMFEIETKYGVRATYYFRDSTVDEGLVNDIHQGGADIGYHYETIAYLVQNGTIKDKEDIDISVARECFKTEYDAFQKRIGFNVETCAAHGAPENLKLGVSNNIIFEDYDPRQLGVRFEAYDPALISKITCYTSDSGIMYNYGYAYSTQPLDAIMNREQVICFLSHPNHWHMSFYERLKKLIRMLIGKGVYSSELTFRRLDK